MRIGFDARMIDHPGIGRYIRNLLRAVLPISGDLEFVLYGRTDRFSDFKTWKKKRMSVLALQP